MIGPMASSDAADILAQNSPSGLEKDAMKAGRGVARQAVRLMLQKASFQVRMMARRAVDAMPGAVSGWARAQEGAEALGGRLPRNVLLSEAIRYSRDGYKATRSQAGLTRAKLDELKDAPGFAATFLSDGKPPEEGTTLRQPALAATLEQLTHAGFDDFYRGDVGREIAADLERIGSPVTRADLETFRAALRDPLEVTIGAGTLHNTPPPTQGLASLMILALFDRL
ncbi:MAG: gamma-glutamyltransferase, partial [Rhizobiales bacterium]|nr:gamma-glutamyltransferase [Hyphomicrobiales bacterium]